MFNVCIQYYIKVGFYVSICVFVFSLSMFLSRKFRGVGVVSSGTKVLKLIEVLSCDCVFYDLIWMLCWGKCKISFAHISTINGTFLMAESKIVPQFPL